MSNRWWFVVVIVIALMAGFVYLSMQSQLPQEQASRQTSPQQGIGGAGITPDASSQLKSFDIEGKPFEYSLKEMRVKRGDSVRVTFTNTEGLHDWGVNEFNARTKQLQVGESETIEFVADKTGTFEYYCSVGNHREMGMRGILIVE